MESTASGLEIIAKWKSDAASDNMAENFYEFKEFNNIVSGDYSFVVGRKGMGKTAIIEAILSRSKANIISRRINFKEFPLDYIESISRDTLFMGRRFVSYWKYVIYNSVLDMAAECDISDLKLKEILADRAPQRPESKIRQSLKRWGKFSFSAKTPDLPYIPSLSLSYDNDHTSEKGLLKDVDLEVELMEDIIADMGDFAQFMVLFDGIDQDFHAFSETEESKNLYKNMISGLFKAIIEVRDFCKGERKKIFPIAFTRDDIFDLVTDSDKEKWSDFVFRINWRSDEIRKLLAHRIVKAYRISSDLDFPKAWNLLFPFGSQVDVQKTQGRSTRKEIFDYIALRTLMRPRDYIRFLQIAARVEAGIDSNAPGIKPQRITGSEHEYSNAMLQEFIDEIGPVFPQFKKLMAIVDYLPFHIFFSYDQFVDLIDRGEHEGILSKEEMSAAGLLHILFFYSVIGNTRKFHRHKTLPPIYYRTFRYIKPFSRLNIIQSMSFHSGLFSVLFPSRNEMIGGTAEFELEDAREPANEILKFEVGNS